VGMTWCRWKKDSHFRGNDLVPLEKRGIKAARLLRFLRIANFLLPRRFPILSRHCRHSRESGNLPAAAPLSYIIPALPSFPRKRESVYITFQSFYLGPPTHQTAPR
jgi:hypothetical protein